MNKIKFKKLKFPDKNLEEDPFCKKSYLITIKKYLSIVLKDMKPSEVSNKRKTEARYGRSALIYNKKTEKKEGKHFYKLVSYYKGDLKDGKAHGWGIEVLKYQSDRIVNPTPYPNHEVVQYYEGEWKKGKRHGYGECYDHHPLIGTASQYQVEGDYIQMSICQDEDGLYSGHSYKGMWVSGIKEGEGIEKSNYKKEEGIFKNENLWTGSIEGLKFHDYQREIKTFKNGKEISKKIIKSNEFDKMRNKMFKMNEILLESILSILPTKFRKRMDKKNYFIHESDSVEENRKIYKYKNNNVYCHYSLNSKDSYDKPIDTPSKIISLSFLRFIDDYKKKYSKKYYRLLSMKTSSACNDYYELIGVGHFKEDNEICKFLRLNENKYNKIADAKFKKWRVNGELKSRQS